MKVVKNKFMRPEIQEKINKALASKPTAAFINSRGLTPEQIIEKYGPPIRIAKTGRNKQGGKGRIQNRPSRGAGSLKEFEASKHKEFDSPKWFKSTGKVDVSIIVPMFRSRQQIKEQIETWDLSDDGLTKEIIYVDDGCPERSYEQVIASWNERKTTWDHPIGRIVINDKNAGFAFACNTGAKYASGKYLLFLNADCVVTPNWIRPMISLMISNPKIGIVGNLQLRKNKIVESAGSEWTGDTFEHIGKSIHQGKPLSAPFTLATLPEDLKQPAERQMVTGSCFLISQELFNQVGGFDLEYRIGYWEDTDLNMKVKTAGYKIFYQPQSIIYHTPGHAQQGHNAYVNQNKAKFKKDWIESGVLNKVLHPHSKPIVYDKAAVFTAISSGYDDLQDAQNTSGNAKFLAFVEDSVASKTWTTQPLAKQFPDPNRNAKIHKILSHKYLPEYEYSLWIDGNIRLLQPLDTLIQTFLQDGVDLVVFNHPERNCLYVEADTCSLRKLDDPATIAQHVARYQKSGFPKDAGLSECTVILRRHSPKIIQFNELWWEEICKGSKRDQISFPYVARKMNLKYAFFPGNLRSPYHFIFKKNKAHRRR